MPNDSSQKMASPTAEPEVAVEETLSDTERLQVLQHLVGNGDRVLKTWATELLHLARIFKHRTDDRGLRLAALGGMAYCLHVLGEGLEGKSLEELMQLYAGVELLSYPRTEAEAEQTRRHYERRGLKVTVHPCQFPDGYLCYRVASAVDQVSKEGVKYHQGELLHSTESFPPPLTSLF